MKFKLKLLAISVILSSLSIFASCSNNEAQSIISNIEENVEMPLHDSLDTRTVFNISTIFQDVNPFETTVGLFQFTEEEEEEIHNEIGWSILLGYTFFDFVGDGTIHRVIFSIDINPIGGYEYSIGADTRVSIKIDNEWLHAWFFSRQLVLTIVAPYTMWSVEDFADVNTLLVVGFSVGMTDVASLIAFRNNQLEVLALTPVDARPDWYWTWQEDDE